jgi:hypothetical protein
LLQAAAGAVESVLHRSRIRHTGTSNPRTAPISICARWHGASGSVDSPLCLKPY